MKKRLQFILIIAGVLFTTCEDRERSNPVDPNADPDAWAPSNLQAEVIDDSQIKLTWAQEDGRISRFRISRKAGSGSFAQIAEVDSDVTEYTDTSLALGTDYTYRVSAFTALNESGHIETIVYFWQDCDGEWGGSAVEDCAGECNGSAKEDCAGECNGTTVEDCNGDCDGTAFENECDYCVGGNTGLVENYCGTVTDVDGFVYEAIIIGNQVWMAENLEVTHYRNGDAIPTGYGGNTWHDLSIGAYSSGGYATVYNWYAVYDSRNIAPEGWHVPTDGEWQILVDYLGGSGVAGGKMKATGTIEGGDGLWYAPNEGATNESDFTALPAGRREGYFQDYYHSGLIGYFWSSTEYNSNFSWAWARAMQYDDSEVWHFYSTVSYGLSVRCVRD